MRRTDKGVEGKAVELVLEFFSLLELAGLHFCFFV